MARRRARAEDGAGSRVNAVYFNQQDFEHLLRESLRSGSLFCDPAFPADWDSLGYDQHRCYSSKTVGVEWKWPTVSSCHSDGLLRLVVSLACSSNPGMTLMRPGLISLLRMRVEKEEELQPSVLHTQHTLTIA